MDPWMFLYRSLARLHVMDSNRKVARVPSFSSSLPTSSPQAQTSSYYFGSWYTKVPKGSKITKGLILR
jgi:hypothetical protein